MTQCTAPIRGHRTAAAAAACPVCGGRRSYYQFGYNTYQSFSSEYSRASNSLQSSGTSNSGMKRKAKWSPVGSTVLYSPAQIMTLTPVRDNIVKQAKIPEKYDLFLCHAWDDRKGAAKELCDKLIAKGVSVWFSEKDLPLGSTMLREIDKGLARSRAGIV